MQLKLLISQLFVLVKKLVIVQFKNLILVFFLRAVWGVLQVKTFVRVFFVCLNSELISQLLFRFHFLFKVFFQRVYNLQETLLDWFVNIVFIPDFLSEDFPEYFSFGSVDLESNLYSCLLYFLRLMTKGRNNNFWNVMTLKLVLYVIGFWVYQFENLQAYLDIAPVRTLYFVRLVHKHIYAIVKRFVVAARVVKSFFNKLQPVVSFWWFLLEIKKLINVKCDQISQRLLKYLLFWNFVNFLVKV